jgi:hypothetical protein
MLFEGFDEFAEAGSPLKSRHAGPKEFAKVVFNVLKLSGGGFRRVLLLKMAKIVVHGGSEEFLMQGESSWLVGRVVTSVE